MTYLDQLISASGAQMTYIQVTTSGSGCTNAPNRGPTSASGSHFRGTLWASLSFFTPFLYNNRVSVGGKNAPKNSKSRLNMGLQKLLFSRGGLENAK